MSDPGQPAPARPRKSAAAFRTIGEAADELEIPTHVVRFWETKFSQLKPVKRSGGRRYYRPEDIALLRQIRQWLYRDGYTIRGVQQLLENNPPAAAIAGGNPGAARRVGTAASDTDIGDDPEARFSSGSDTEAADRAAAAALSGADRDPGFLDAETRAELDGIRRELLDARQMLEALLRQSTAS